MNILLGDMILKIVQVCPRFHPYVGGIETHVQQLSLNLIEKGFDFTVISVDSSRRLQKEEILNGIKILRVPGYAVNEDYLIPISLYKLIKNIDYDILHVHSYHAFPALVSAFAHNRKRKFVFTPHFIGFPTSPYKKFLHMLYMPFGRRIFNIADKVICVSMAEIDLFNRVFNVPKSKSVYIPLPIDTRNIEYISPKFKDPHYINICCIGRLSKEKNVNVLLRAFRIIKEKYPLARLIIVGEGPEENNLKNLARNLKLDHTKFMGKLSKTEVYSILKNSDILVHPARFTGTCDIFKSRAKFAAGGPLDAIEAMTIGVPVIMTPVGDLPRFVKESENCLFINENDPEDLANKIQILIDHPDIANRMSKSARTIVERELDMNNIINKYEKIYGVIGGAK